MTDKTATVFAEITKSDEREDGTLDVFGIVSDETLDVDRQIADGAWLKTAIPSWFSSAGNIREMHQPIAAGIATEYTEKDGAHTIVAHIVDDSSIKKVKAGVLRGFSIGIRGPRVVVDKAASGGRIVGGQVVEVSLVDRPANPSCTLTLAKAATPGVEVIAADFDESTGLVKTEELVEGEEAAHPAPEGDGQASGAVEPAVEGASEKGAGVGSVTDEEFEVLLKRDFTADQRRRMAGRGQAMPAGGFPVANVADLENAIHAIGRAKDPEAARAHVKARAKALGRTDLIPDTWKSVQSGDEHAHDPAMLAGIRNGLLQCLIAEAQEAMGGEDELCDLSSLVGTLAQFLCWWDHEAREGETEPSTSMKSAESEEIPVTDLAPELTEPVKLATKDATPDLVKSAVAEAVSAARGELQQLVDDLTARLETVEKMAAPGGPVRMRTKAASIAAHGGDALRVEIMNLKTTMATLDDAGMKAAYGEMILAREAKLNELTQVAAS